MLKFVLSILFGSIFVLGSFGQTKELKLKTTDFENRSLVYSPDGKLLVASSGKDLIIWYADSESEYATIETPHQLISSVVFHPSGKSFITAGKDGVFSKTHKILWWDLETQSVKAEIGIHSKEVLALALSKDGRFLASGGADKTLKVWNLDELELSYEQSNPKGLILSLDFHSTRELLAIGRSDSKVIIRNSRNGSEIHSFDDHAGWVRKVLFSPDGKTLAAAGEEDFIQIIDLEDENYPSQFLEGHKGWIHDLAFSPDNKYLASGSSKNDLIIWNVQDYVIHTSNFMDNNKSIRSLSFNPNGKFLSTLYDASKDLTVWNVDNLGIVPIYRHKDKDDKTGPQIFVSNPPNITDDRVRFSGGLMDIEGVALDESGIRQLRVNGMETPVKENGKFVIKLPLTTGDNFVTIEVTDINDNIALKKFVINRQDLDGGEFKSEDARNYLFIVGINNYEYWPKLFNAVKDANEVAGTLVGMYNFDFTDVTILLDEQATRNNIYKHLRGFIEKLTPQDNLVIYYSGHGHYDELVNEGYWIPYEAHLDSEGEYLPNSSILKILGNYDSQHIFLVVDACFSGSLFAATSRGYNDNVEKYRSRWALASGRLETVSDGAYGENSPFANKFLEFLRTNQKDRFAVSELVQYVKIQVADETDQTPIGNPLKNIGDEGGELIFIKK